MFDEQAWVGKMLGQYELRELIDDSLILTFRAYQPRLKRLVTVQMLRPEMGADTRLREGIARGAEIMAGMEHANIVPVIDYGEDRGIPYIAIRSMQGGSLRARLQQGAFSLNDAGGIIRQIGSALDYVHTQGNVHGDPSPRNMGFDLSGSAYITDFLFIGMLNEGSEIVLGSKRYAAPERWRDEPPTPATDQYALAGIAYHLITGNAPFENSDRAALKENHLSDMPIAPQIHRTEIPLGVNDVLFRALAKQPQDRYPTVLDFAREFEKALNAAPQHVFISYSRRDSAYAIQLREHLQQSGFQMWIDSQIEQGDQWFNQIHEAIKTSAAFLVIMTPDAENSEWVQKEILLAKRYKKPIFPLLLKEDEFALLIDLQFADVRGEQLPGEDFHRRLSRAIHGMM